MPKQSYQIRTTRKLRTNLLSLIMLTLSLFAAAFFTNSLIPKANASYYDFGTLDVRPVTENNWFVESLKPGEKKQEQLMISNFSSRPKELILYVADAEGKDNNFIAKSLEQKSEDIISWIKLPTAHLILPSGQSRILSVNFDLPNNAGVGYHTGAIIVRELNNKTPGTTSLIIEKGVRVYLNVPGISNPQIEIASLNLGQQDNLTNLRLTLKNTGNTDIRTNYSIGYSNLLQTPTAKASPKDATAGADDNLSEPSPGKILIKPGEEKTITLSTEQPSFGLTSLYLYDGNSSTLIQNFCIIPLWAFLLLLLPLVLFTVYRSLKTKAAANQLTSDNIIPNLHCLPSFCIACKARTNSKRHFTTFAFTKNLVFAGLLLLAIELVINIPPFESSLFKTQTITPKVANSYILNIKWGNFRDVRLPPTYSTKWMGEIDFQNARIAVNDVINFTANDSIQVENSNTVLKYNNTSGPANNEVILSVTPTTDQEPVLVFKNKLTGAEETHQITEYLPHSGTILNGLFSMYIKTDLGPELQIQSLSATEPALELSATPEIEATPETHANIPELRNLFIEELPATPEVLANYILTSDYVEKIGVERDTASIITDQILIKTLEATPEIISDLAATPELNFIFVPTRPITFPAQEFSFRQEKVATESLGPLIFVQNKNTEWNTYVGTTDFTSLSGKGVIPASSLTLIPGEAKILGAQGTSQIRPGESRTFNGTFDKATLVNVKPEDSNQQMFLLNPVLQIKIPANTAPGRYHGTLTITSL